MKAAYSNNFTLLRLIAAWMILFGHCFKLYDYFPDPMEYYLGYFGVTSLALAIFFVISGYLVTASWVKQNSVKHYVINRVFRIVPGLAVVTIITTFILGPLVTTLAISDYFAAGETWKYLRNILVFGMRYTLPSIFEDLPYPNVVNGSLWSLKLEVRLYILLAILGLCRLLSARLVLAWALLCLTVHAMLTLHYEAPSKYIHGIKYDEFLLNIFWGYFFWVGSACYLFREKLRFTFPLFFLTTIIGITSWYTGSYGHYITYLCLPYIILYLALGTVPTAITFLQKNDLSYGIYLYAFPIQQGYMHFIGEHFGLSGFIIITTVITLFMAYLSWKYIEHPILHRKPSATRSPEPTSNGQYAKILEIR